MPSDLIRVNHEHLLQIARAFDDEGGRVDVMLRSMRAQREALSTRKQWVGKAADAFYARMDGELLPELQRLLDSLRTGADTVRSIQRDMLSAEQDAAQLLRLPDAGPLGRVAPLRPGPPQTAPAGITPPRPQAIGTQPASPAHTQADWLLVSPLFGLDTARAVWEAIPDVY